MKMSSVGARPSLPPQTIAPPTFKAISLNSSAVNSTGARTSIVSAVPVGLVMALLDVFGMRTPKDATIGTMRRLTLFPGTPPMECFSNAGLPKSIFSPVSTMALVRASISSMLIP